MALDSFQDTFMLLPNFNISPDKDIVLGTLLRRAKGLKTRPDPNRPLNRYAGATFQAAEHPRYHDITDFHFEGTHGRGGKLGVFADVPILSALAGSLGYVQFGTTGLCVDCARVEVHTFEPSAEYLVQALAANKLVEDYVQESWRPSIFLVTGLMIAHGAKIAISRGSNSKGEASISADLTAIGAPANIGAGSHFYDANETQRRLKMEGPFILSYRLQRLRVSKKGTFQSSAQFNRFALMGGNNDDQYVSADEVLGRGWETEMITASALSAAADEESDENGI